MQHNITLEKCREYSDFIDFEILADGNKIGTLDIRSTESFIFIRHIRIEEKFRRNGYAREAVDQLRLLNKPISLAISTHSESAAPFWQSYFQGKHVTCQRKTYYIN